jgi:hypothetical protein
MNCESEKQGTSGERKTQMGFRNYIRYGWNICPAVFDWDAVKQFHPYKKEILIVVRALNSIGATRNIIAAALNLQGWKTFYADSEWTQDDVNSLLK